MLNKLQGLIDEGTIIVGQENSLYKPKTPVLLGRECLTAVEGFKVDADPACLSEHQYYVIVDFSFLNLTDLEHFSKSNCILSDGKEDFHSLKIIKTEGDVRFNRFDLVFAVPVSSRFFVFTFNTGLDVIEKIRFKVNMDSLEDEIGTPKGCMFFIDDPVEPIATQQPVTVPL